MTATTAQMTRAKKRAKVLNLVDRGLPNRAIAAKVGVSESTVRRWRTDDAPHRAAAPVTDAPPAAPPHTLTVALDGDLSYHLGVLAEAGHDPQEAIGKAVAFLSDAYAYAWDYGVNERGVVPEIRFQVKGDQWPPTTPW